MPPCRRPSWIRRACVPENGRDGRLDMGVEISGSGNVSADGWAAWELTAAPVPLGIGTYVRLWQCDRVLSNVSQQSQSSGNEGGVQVSADTRSRGGFGEYLLTERETN